ncbi:MAG: YgiQ family radical SAM protein [Prevotella pallens]|uniref:YgiQ family radical SAM protein n=1 Tax=Prevotella pallens TaxID=60133 RepID=UPI001CB3FC83|nr:YgiQ family radical SAM protein [Prevotella pallens]MBF1485572.1 YgiQ family radical SAM protein [Prevotella pallens]MBF1489508.1 YgiQ family radical SAM protein [Prevotella pallens]MBF1491299.1 YgiQ family radical SAM protein [Prevotella pallens]MBF1493483.1 YgiQ family radical SAM protein [Prevotella pallens]
MSNNKSTRRQNKPSYKANIKPLQKDLNTGEQKNKNQIVQTNSRFMLTDFLPTTKKEVELRGWGELDVILFSGDAYIDHPAFGVSVIGRVLEAAGYRVAIIPQPDWHGDFRDFKKLGRPRLFFGVSAGAMDSMVNKYTANKRLRSEDAYSPNGRHDLRPEYPSIVYSNILRQLYPDVPIVLGGIEASLRRLTHYDYWKDCIRKSVLCDSGADIVIYGMGEKQIISIAQALENGRKIKAIKDIPQTAYLCKERDIPEGITTNDIVLHSHEECLYNKKFQAENFKHIEEESNKKHAQRILQKVDSQYIVVNPPYPTMTTEEVDATYDLPYTREPHPKYKGKVIPAYEMIKFSVNIHRGCFGGCSFCTISAHQGKFIASRSKESILKEVKQVIQMPDFKGYLSDLGGPSANMYGMAGKNIKACEHCKRPSCIHPEICPNLNTDHSKLLDIYRTVDALPGIKKSFIGSGVRYDLLLHNVKDEKTNHSTQEYTRELIKNHVSGRLKIAPEHTSDRVLYLMRKPSFKQFYQFKRIFDKINKEENLRQQIIPYFISSHPGCKEEDMAELAVITKDLDFHLEQVQDFTPTPMTVSTEAWYSGYDPYTLEPVFSAKTPREKLAQRQFFFWYKPEERRNIEKELKRIGRIDLIGKLYDNKPFRGKVNYDPKAIGSSPSNNRRNRNKESYNQNKDWNKKKKNRR